MKIVIFHSYVSLLEGTCLDLFDTNIDSLKAGAPLVRTKLPHVLKPRNTSDQRWRQPLLGSSHQNLRICLSANHLLDLMPGKSYKVDIWPPPAFHPPPCFAQSLESQPGTTVQVSSLRVLRRHANLHHDQLRLAVAHHHAWVAWMCYCVPKLREGAHPPEFAKFIPETQEFKRFPYVWTPRAPGQSHFGKGFGRRIYSYL